MTPSEAERISGKPTAPVADAKTGFSGVSLTSTPSRANVGL